MNVVPMIVARGTVALGFANSCRPAIVAHSKPVIANRVSAAAAATLPRRLTWDRGQRLERCPPPSSAATSATTAISGNSLMSDGDELNAPARARAARIDQR